MKIAYNSAYVHIETVNFTFTHQAVIVYFYIYSSHRRGYCQLYNLASHNSQGPNLQLQSAATKPRHRQHCYIFAPMLRPTPLTLPNDSLTGSHTSAQLCIKVPIDYNGMPQIHPQLPLPIPRKPPHLLHPFLDRPHSPPQTASGSAQPFCHNTLCRQTDDRPTDRWSR